MDELQALQAWCNGYDIVAARNQVEAREVMRQRPCMASYSDDKLDGDGWRTLDPKMVVREDGADLGTVASFVAESPEPRWMCSIEQWWMWSTAP